MFILLYISSRRVWLSLRYSIYCLNYPEAQDVASFADHKVHMREYDRYKSKGMATVSGIGVQLCLGRNIWTRKHVGGL